MVYTFHVEKPLHLVSTGKFVSPSPKWMHTRRVLKDYELFVLTRGILYIADDQEKYVLNEGDYLLMPPGSQQYGYRPSDYSFYWLHFKPDTPSTVAYQAEAYESSNVTIAIPVTGKLSRVEKMIVMMKQLQDSIRSYRDPTLNNYFTTSA